MYNIVGNFSAKKKKKKKNNRVYFEASEFDERKEIRWKIYYYSFENNS